MHARTRTHTQGHDALPGKARPAALLGSHRLSLKVTTCFTTQSLVIHCGSLAQGDALAPRSDFYVTYLLYSGFGGLGVACWPLVPKFASSNPAEAVGFLRAKKSSARLPSEGK